MILASRLVGWSCWTSRNTDVIRAGLKDIYFKDSSQGHSRRREHLAQFRCVQPPISAQQHANLNVKR
jgi:hypothetical protein